MKTNEIVVLHCSASDIPRHDSIDVVRGWHKARGWRDIGYQWFIDKKGGTYQGRKESDIGAHCKGHNSNSIGICLSGLNDFTDIQFEKCAELVMRIMDDYNLSTKDIYLHNEFNSNKTCPNFKKERVTSRIFGPFGQ